jgi:hypothetical protein
MYQTEFSAVSRAIKRAQASGDVRYVVFESGEYSICVEDDLDTFFLGAPVVAVVAPDGDVTYARSFF